MTGIEIGMPIFGSDGVEAGRVTSLTSDEGLGRLKAPYFEASEVECAGRRLSVAPLLSSAG